jgi:hypothetical protein
MDTLRAIFCVAMIGELLAGCGSNDAPAPAAKAAKVDVNITVDGVHHACIVALSTEAQGSSIACGGVAAFLKDELRVPSGALYDLRTIPEVSEAELAAVAASLKSAGYRFVGDR